MCDHNKCYTVCIDTNNVVTARCADCGAEWNITKSPKSNKNLAEQIMELLRKNQCPTK